MTVVIIITFEPRQRGAPAPGWGGILAGVGKWIGFPLLSRSLPCGASFFFVCLVSFFLF